jgi:hypothetical protein
LFTEFLRSGSCKIRELHFRPKANNGPNLLDALRIGVTLSEMLPRKIRELHFRPKANDGPNLLDALRIGVTLSEMLPQSGIITSLTLLHVDAGVFGSVPAYDLLFDGMAPLKQRFDFVHSQSNLRP